MLSKTNISRIALFHLSSLLVIYAGVSVTAVVVFLVVFQFFLGASYGKYFFIFFLITSCAEIQKKTNVNMMAEAETVKVLDNEAQAANCNFIKDVKGEDNLLNMGKETAVSNMKRYAQDKGANALWVSECRETTTAIANIIACSGKAFSCP